LAVLTDPEYYRASALAQIILSKAHPDLKPDGKWGTFTQSAYEKAPEALRLEVDQLLSRLTPSTTVDELRTYRNTQRSKGPVAVKVNSADSGWVKDLIIKLAGEEGVPSSTALKIAYLESRYLPRAVSPTGAIGVYQLTSIARRDIEQRGKYKVTDPYDATDNIRGGLKYIKLVARDLGVPLTATAEVYMGFNIGPTGAKNVLAGKPELASSQIRLQAYGKQGPHLYAANLRAAVEAA